MRSCAGYMSQNTDFGILFEHDKDLFIIIIILRRDCVVHREGILGREIIPPLIGNLGALWRLVVSLVPQLLYRWGGAHCGH
jgi:hypothetical protein